MTHQLPPEFVIGHHQPNDDYVTSDDGGRGLQLEFDPVSSENTLFVRVLSFHDNNDPQHPQFTELLRRPFDVIIRFTED